MRDAVVLTGGTGLIGSRVARDLVENGREVRVLSRRAEVACPVAGAEARWRSFQWDGVAVPLAALRGAGCVVHLSGEPIFGGPLTQARRQRIRASRIDSTEAIVAGIASLPDEERPHSLVCASAIGIYGDRGDEELDEASFPGAGYLARVCEDWEAAAEGARQHGLRVVRLRTGVVLARDGGALSLMLPAFRFGGGARLGDGTQWFPWVHIDDAVALMLRCTLEEGWDGPVNVVAPNPVTNGDFTSKLAATLRRPALLFVPAFLIRLAMGPISEELLFSRRVLPKSAERRGFEFRFARLQDALSSLLS